MTTRNRPLSPHLQIYRPQLTSVLSITHRATGVLLAIGTPLLVYWFVAIAAGASSYATATDLFSSASGRLILFVWSYALFYHLCNGIRHLVWDVGRGFELPTVYRSGWAVVLASGVLTLSAWLFGYLARGASM